MKLANPAPLGLTGFALATWMFSMVSAGWFTGDSLPLVLASAFAFGGTAQFAARLMKGQRGDTFGFVTFCSHGAFWWTFALFVQLFSAKVSPDFVGWRLIMWGVVMFCMWVATLAPNRADGDFGLLAPALAFCAAAALDVICLNQACARRMSAAPQS